MMKRLKRTALVILAALMVFSLSSCEALDDAKKSQAFWMGEKFNSSIEYDGRTYERLPEFSNEKESCLVPTERGTINPINVTERDVPVLLAEFYGAYGNYYPESGYIFLCGEYYADSEHAAALRAAAGGEMADYCYYKMEYDEARECYSSEYVVLSASEREAIKKAFSKENIFHADTSDPYYQLNREIYDWADRILQVWHCDDSALVWGDVFNICQTTVSRDGVPGNLFVVTAECAYAFDESDVPVIEALLERGGEKYGYYDYEVPEPIDEIF